MLLADWKAWVMYWLGLNAEPSPVVSTDSAEACVLRAVAEMITECSAAQDLAEETTEAATRQRVVIGPHMGPWQGDKFTVDELASRFIEFQVFVPTEGGRVVVNDGVLGDRGDENGTIQITTRRFVRDSESKGPDQSALYLFFLDKIAKFEEQMVMRAKDRGISIRTITRDQGPALGTKKSKTAQGDYLFTTHSLTWGDFIQQ